MEPLLAGDVLLDLVLLTEPQGVVMDAFTRQPIKQAVLSLHEVSYDGDAQVQVGNLAALPLVDGLEQSNPQFSTEDGSYGFQAEPGEYIIKAAKDNYQVYHSQPQAFTDGLVVEEILMYPLADQRLAISMVTDKTYVNVGDTVTFELTLENSSPAPISSVEIIDYLPDALDVEPTSITHAGVYDASSGTITWTVNNLQPRSEVTMSFKASVGPVADGSEIDNLAVARIAGETKGVWANVPIYGGSWPTMRLDKRANRDQVIVGDLVRYTITVENLSQEPHLVTGWDLYVEDRIPAGFVYLPGSSSINGTAISDPLQDDPMLTWQLGNLAPNESVTLNYVLALGVNAHSSNGVNVARVGGLSTAGFPFVTPQVSATVGVESGAFGTSGTIVGKVFYDTNGNGLQDPGEQGLSNIRLITDEGLEITTDKNGLYSLRNVQPGVHNIKYSLSGCLNLSLFPLVDWLW